MDQTNGRVFCGVRPGGIVWADRQRLNGGDYSSLAFLPYDTLELKLQPDCPQELRAEITAAAAIVQAKRGTWYYIPSCRQSVLLGGGA